MILATKHPIELHTLGKFNSRLGTKISAVQVPGGPTIYVLYDPEGTHVATCSSPKPLASYAFNAGAIDVEHAYDLRASERN